MHPAVPVMPAELAADARRCREPGAGAVLDEAVRRGLDARIGLEDTVQLPDGSRAVDNVSLLVTAVARGAA
jgi:uncharacterized protein (DUF849 family)